MTLTVNALSIRQTQICSMSGHTLNPLKLARSTAPTIASTGSHIYFLSVFNFYSCCSEDNFVFIKRRFYFIKKKSRKFILPKKEASEFCFSKV